MKVFLADLGIDFDHSARREFHELAAHGGGRHEVTDDPAAADVVLFTEWHQLGDPIVPSRLLTSRTFREFRRKSYAFDQRPRSYCALPGLYTSVPWRHLRGSFQIPWSYHRVTEPQAVPGVDLTVGTEPDLLFSYVGSGRTHPCRTPLFELNHPDGLIRRVEGHLNWVPRAEGYADRRRFFAESILRSQFVLCPRGRATSSFRFYEVLAAGRVPVVISDDWVPPAGVNLAEFAVRWPEGQADGLIAHLEQLRPLAASMGDRAREVFEANFSQDAVWDATCDRLESLHASRPWDRFPHYGFPPDRRVGRHLLGRVHRAVDTVRARRSSIGS